MRRGLAIALIALIVSPVTLPLASCTWLDLMGGLAATAFHLAPPSPLQTYRPFKVRVLPGEDWTRITTDTQWRQAAGWSRPRFAQASGPTQTHRHGHMATKLSPLVLRI
jgi:hypothetical protein